MQHPLMTSAFTRCDYDLLPEGFPAQLIDGMLVRTPSPNYGHQRFLTRLLMAFAPHVDEGLVVPAPADVAIDDHNVFQPDLVVLRAAPDHGSSYVGTPRLAVEVLSPSTKRWDRQQKMPALLGAGVEEVWLVDPEARAIERFWPDAEARFEGDEPVTSRVLPDLRLTPAQLFA